MATNPQPSLDGARRGFTPEQRRIEGETCHHPPCAANPRPRLPSALDHRFASSKAKSLANEPPSCLDGAQRGVTKEDFTATRA